MRADVLLLEMLTDEDLGFALRAAGIPPGPRLDATVAGVRRDPALIEALLDDTRLFSAVSADPQILLHVSPYFHFSVLLRRALRELRGRSFTAEWLAPRRRVPVFDAQRVAGVLADRDRMHYLAEMLASFAALRRPAAAGNAGPQRARRFHELSLRDLRQLRERASDADRFSLDRRLGDVALFLAGVFPDSARGAPEMEAWEWESEHCYRQAAREPLASECGLRETLDALASELHPARKALNFVADRFLQPLRNTWFAAGA